MFAETFLLISQSTTQESIKAASNSGIQGPLQDKSLHECP